MSERLVYIGLSGLAGSGKTTTADLLAPSVGQFYHDAELAPNEIFTHYTLAAPIYDMVGILRMTEGDAAKERILYQMHEIIFALIGMRLPYNDFIALVKMISAMPVGTEYDPKPRQFMIDVGDHLRDIFQDCFAHHMYHKILLDTDSIDRDYWAMGIEPPAHYVVVSDVRYQNEIDFLRRTNRLIMVKLDVSFKTANQRLLDRDGVSMTLEQWAHPTEAGFDDSEFDLVVDTNELEKIEVATKIREYIMPRHVPILLGVAE